jgi:hypothetical protein
VEGLKHILQRRRQRNVMDFIEVRENHLLWNYYLGQCPLSAGGPAPISNIHSSDSIYCLCEKSSGYTGRLQWNSLHETFIPLTPFIAFARKSPVIQGVYNETAYTKHSFLWLYLLPLREKLLLYRVLQWNSSYETFIPLTPFIAFARKAAVIQGVYNETA